MDGVTRIVGTDRISGFSGFFSKDAIIEAVHHSQIAGAGTPHVLLVAGVSSPRFTQFPHVFPGVPWQGPRDEHAKAHLHESPAVVTVPLVLLAIPSVFIGYFTVGPMLFRRLLRRRADGRCRPRHA